MGGTVEASFEFGGGLYLLNGALVLIGVSLLVTSLLLRRPLSRRWRATIVTVQVVLAVSVLVVGALLALGVLSVAMLLNVPGGRPPEITSLLLYVLAVMSLGAVLLYNLLTTWSLPRALAPGSEGSLVTRKLTTHRLVFGVATVLLGLVGFLLQAFVLPDAVRQRTPPGMQLPEEVHIDRRQETVRSQTSKVRMTPASSTRRKRR